MRQEFVRVCRSYVGTKYGHQGRMPGVLLDCVGVPICAAKELGLKPVDFDVTGYGRRPDGSLLTICREHMIEISRSEMQAGDVVVLAGDGDPTHLGVLWDYSHDKLGIVHARAGGLHSGRVVEHRLMFGPKLRFCAAFKIPGID